MVEVVKTDVHGAIAVVGVDSPPINAIGAAVREGLMAQLGAALSNDAVEAIVLICRGRTFFAGADISEMGKPPQSPTLHDVMRLIEMATKPVVAAIHGTALGGGLETALACHYRIMASSAAVGLPEVHLGLLPGGGGTQRLPRLVGVERALDLMITGRTIDATEAKQFGIVDRICPQGNLEHDAIVYAKEVVAAGARLPQVRDLTVHIDVARTQPGIFHKFRRDHAELMHGYKAPSHIVSAVQAAVDLSFEEGLDREWELFRELEDSAESAAQRYIFFAERDAAKAPDITRDVRPKPLFRFALIGHAGSDPGWRPLLQAAALDVRYFDDWREFLAAPDRAFDVVLETSAQPPASKAQLADWLATGDPPTVVGLADIAAANLEAFACPLQGAVLGLALTGGKAGIVEVARGTSGSPLAAASIGAMMRRLGIAPVITRAQGRFAIERLLSAKAAAIKVLKQDGANGTAIDVALQDFGFPVEDADGEPFRETPSIQSVLDAMTEEGVRMLKEGVVYRGSDIDFMAVRAAGWPIYRHGPMSMSSIEHPAPLDFAKEPS